MSANNEICVMIYNGLFHIWYNPCADNTPEKPNFDDRFYKEANNRKDALIKAFNLKKQLEKECYFIEYGVIELN